MAINIQQMVDAAEAALVAELQAAHDLALAAAIGVKNEEMAAAIAANDDQWFSTLNTQLAAKDAEIVQLQQTVTQKDAEIAALQVTVSSMQANMATMQATLTSVQGELASVQAELASIVATMSGKDQQIAQLTATVSAKDAQIAILEARIAELEAGVPAEPEPEPEPPAPPPPATGFWQGLNSAWPTAATTGPRIALSAHTGSYNINSAQTFKGKRFTGQVTITAHDTVFEDCEFVCTGNWGIDADLKRITIRNCRFIGQSGNREAAVLGIMDIQNCDISGFKDGLKPQGANVVVRQNYIHDLYAGPGAHNDGIQVQGDGPNCLIEQNYIKARDTSAIMLQPQYPLSGYTIRHNWLGGADLPLRIEAGCTNCVAYENVLERGYWGYHDISGSPQSQGRNIDSVTGAAI